MDAPRIMDDPREVLDRLLTDPHRIDPAVCLEHARRIEESLRCGQPTDEVALAVLRLLASDPKWEVRKIVADALVFLGDGGFLEMATQMSVDVNSYVKMSGVGRSWVLFGDASGRGEPGGLAGPVIDAG